MLTTWDEFRQMLAQAYENVDLKYELVADSLMHGASRKDVLDTLSTALADARNNLDNLVTLAIRCTPPEPPARPLEAVLADIEALGFRYTLSPENLTTYLDAVGPAGDCCWWKSTYFDVDAGVVAAAEAEVTRLRELHAGVVVLVETLTVHPAPLLPPEAQAQAAECEAFWAEIDAAFDAGPDVETRWNIWQKTDDGDGWVVVNSNLNEVQARRAIDRRSGDPFEYVALPIGQVPPGRPLSASDTLVFLNQDPDVQSITGPTDDEEAKLAGEERQRVDAASESEDE